MADDPSYFIPEGYDPEDWLGSLPPAERARIEARVKFLDKVLRGVGHLTAAAAVGWSPSRLEREMADADFADAVSIAEEMKDELIEQTVFEKAQQGNVSLLTMWLYNRRPGKWKDPKQRDAAIGISPADQTIVLTAVEAVRAMAMAEATRAVGALGRAPAIDGEVIEDSDG